MDLENFDWKNSYDEFVSYLYQLREDRIEKCSHNLISTKYKMIGISIPKLRLIAKQISKVNYEEFLAFCSKQSYEEIMLYGMVIGYAKVDCDKRLSMLKNFLPLIDNWAVNDCVASTLVDIKNNYKYYYDWVKGLTHSQNIWEIRFGVILLMDYYLIDDYVDQVISLIQNVQNNTYYVMMGRAWAISVIFVKYREKAINLLKSKSLDSLTQNKSIQKIRESNRVSKEDKEYVLKFKM